MCASCALLGSPHRCIFEPLCLNCSLARCGGLRDLDRRGHVARRSPTVSKVRPINVIMSSNSLIVCVVRSTGIPTSIPSRAFRSKFHSFHVWGVEGPRSTRSRCATQPDGLEGRTDNFYYELKKLDCVRRTLYWDPHIDAYSSRYA